MNMNKYNQSNLQQVSYSHKQPKRNNFNI